MSKPLIAVPVRYSTNHGRALYSVNDDYLLALEEYGGQGLLIPPHTDAQAIAQFCDGLLLTGGGDVDPSLYQAQPNEKTEVESSLIDELDEACIQAFLEEEKPILGICRGIQILNVYFKGTLCQDIPTYHPSDVPHRRNDQRFVGSHNVILSGDLAEQLGTHTLWVNSIHHQAIEKLGEGLTVVGQAEDGLIEAVMGPHVVAVQWHPECLRDKDGHRQLFQQFIARCQK